MYIVHTLIAIWSASWGAVLRVVRGRRDRCDYALMHSPLFMFGSFGEQTTRYMYLAGGLLALGALMCLAQVVRSRRQSRVEARNEHNRVLAVMQLALESDCRFDLFPAQRDKTVHTPMLRGKCVKADVVALFFMFDLTPEVSSWKHTDICLYFRLHRNNETEFLSFVTKVIRQQIKQGRLVMEVELPARLGNDQKRGFFRLEPGLDSVRGAALWPFAPTAEEQEVDALPSRGKPLGKPPFFYHPPRYRQVWVDDLSGGGVRLRLYGARYKEVGAQYEVGMDFMMLIMLFSGEGMPPVPSHLWLQCRCRHIDKMPHKGAYGMGLQFSAWGISKTIGDVIVWRSLGDNGEVPPVLDWLLAQARLLNQRKHLVE